MKFLGKITSNDAVLAAILPILGYVTAYGFETGYLAYYNIDSRFIDLGIESIIFSTLTLLLTFLAIYTILEIPFIFIMTLLKSKFAKTAIGQAFIQWLIISLLVGCFVFFFTTGDIFLKIKTIVATTLVMGFYYFGLPLLFSKKGNLEERFEKERESKRNAPNTLNYIWKKPLLLKLYIALILTAGVFTLSYLVGFKKAANTQEFYLIEEIKNQEKISYVLVRKYESYSLFIKANLEERTLSSELKLVPLEEIYYLKKEKIEKLIHE